MPGPTDAASGSAALSPFPLTPTKKGQLPIEEGGEQLCVVSVGIKAGGTWEFLFLIFFKRWTFTFFIESISLASNSEFHGMQEVACMSAQFNIFRVGVDCGGLVPHMISFHRALATPLFTSGIDYPNLLIVFCTLRKAEIKFWEGL